MSRASSVALLSWALVAFAWEKKLDVDKLDKHQGGDIGRKGDVPDCFCLNMPKQWWEEIKAAGIHHGTKEHLELEIKALKKLHEVSEADKWPAQWKENWGDESKACQWPGVGKNGMWKGVTCHGHGMFSPPPPDALGGHVSAIQLTHGLLKGPIPEEFKYLVAVYEFEVSHNKLTGPLPDTGYWLACQKFDVSYNQLSGTLQDDFLTAPCLSTLNLANNQFEGPIPKSLRSRTVMMSLKLANNKFSGTIPDFTNMPELKELDLSGNQLSGTIPDSVLNLPKLRWLRLHQNKLSGGIPEGINKLPHLSVLSVAGNPDMDKKVPDTVSELPLRVFNGTEGMTCSSPTLLRHVPESTACGGSAIGGSRATFLPPP